MKNTKKEVPTVNETVDTSKETKIIDKETLPNLMKTDQLIEYCGYVKNCCSDLGTKNDSAEGWDDYINFQKEIAAARISTFEPDSIDDDHSFENTDLTGDNIPIEAIPMSYWAFVNGAMFNAYTMNGGLGVTPFDMVGIKGDYVTNDNVGITPFDLDEGALLLKSVKQSEPVLTA